jgi:predicted solute-binding protein
MIVMSVNIYHTKSMAEVSSVHIVKSTASQYSVLEIIVLTVIMVFQGMN